MSSWVNYDDVISQMAAHGFDVSSALEVGTMQRVKREGHKQKGWYVLHEVPIDDAGINTTGLIGVFGYFIGGDSFKENISLGRQYNLDKSQLDAIKKRQKEAARQAEAERKNKQNIAAKRATAMWARYAETGESDYLKRKGVGVYGLKFAPSGNGTIAIPLKDVNGRVHGLQIVRGKDRGKKMEKEYWPVGLAKKGHFHTIGVINRKTKFVLVAEGYATAATLHDATGAPVLVAFDAYNLSPVAEAYQKKFPKLNFLICADDDYLTEGNPGIKAAQTAALAVGGEWVAPTFPFDRNGKKLTDFNDLANFENCSNATIAAQIEDKTLNLGWGVDDSTSEAGAVITQGGGEALQSLLNVDEAVARYSLIYAGQGTLFDHQERTLVLKSDVLDICEDRIWPVWKWHADRRVVRLTDVGFDPTGKENLQCNLWHSWPTVPKEGQCDLILTLLRWLCSGEEAKNSDAIYNWVLKWLAFPIQNPGAKMRTALIMHGPQGAGKNLFFEDAYLPIFERYARVVGQEEIEDRFNDWASGKVFMVADEVASRQELYHLKNKLKKFITGPTIRINPKNVAAHDEKNHVNLVFLSNETQPLVLEEGDRRYLVIWTPDKQYENVYSDIAEEINAGGIEALHHYLLNLDLGDFNEHSKPPMTKSKQDLIDMSLGSVEQFVRDWLNGDIGLPVIPCTSNDCYKSYMRWCKRNGVSRPRELSQFAGNVGKMSGWVKERKRVFNNLHYDGDAVQLTMIFPPVEMPVDIEGSSEAQKNTAAYFRFRAEMGGDDAEKF